ncbi:MAG: delta 1-pyrroline-5-carboxylate reductase [Alectoria sarmentosa]|nr:MAG: delta 1-pyrroline-5-carboxylate reductase [Alectoria sarmentosa]CAD6593899.1 MAG: delta 1-pyrroline-5-carboxylate reductase [Alectoria sarmentosa]
MSVDIIPTKITFLGCGKLNTAILSGILSSLPDPPSTFQAPTHTPNEKFLPNPTVITPTSLTACVHHQSSSTSLIQKFSHSPLVTVLANENVPGVQRGDIIILGVEPSVYRSVLAEPGMLDALKGKTLVSIVGGVSVSKLYDAIFHSLLTPLTTSEREKHCHIMRVTPGPSAAVRASVSLISEEADRRYPPAVLTSVYSLFMRVGQVKMWPEQLQPAGATLLAGGLAFLSVAVEGMVDGAVSEGVEREEALQMAASCLAGLSKLLEGGESPGGVRGKVATPGGSTAAGLEVLEEGRVKELYKEALRVTTFRTSRLDDPKE